MSVYVDMDTCNKKEKCLFGPNEGEAYDPKNPCGGVGSFDDEICDCVIEASERWTIDYIGPGQGDQGSASCAVENCAPLENVAFLSTSFAVQGHLIVPRNEVEWCTISGSCPQGPQNCGTWKDLTGADYIWLGSRFSHWYDGDEDAPCGASDVLMQNFEIVSGPGYPPGTIISLMLTNSWTGAVGCCFQQFSVVDVYPEVQE